MTGRKVRTKKLGVKTPLPVLREKDIDQGEYNALVTENQIATGVDQAEENEFHLQTILKNAGTSNDQEIPVPPPQPSDVVYGDLYKTQWEEPKSYIRSSATVEECIEGAAYDMTREDDEFLTGYNEARAAGNRLSEDDFEAVIDVFESASLEQMPQTPADGAVVVVPYEHMVASLGQLNLPTVIQHAPAVYEHWRSRRKETGNKPLHATLKFETHQETDDTDPYVCFRRREARQTRKTRARDVQMTERLKRLRRELEDGRQLIIDTFERERLKRQCLNLDRDVFDQRARLKEIKVRLGIRTEDEDLYNHKPPKRKAPDAPAARLQLRMPVRPDARAIFDNDLTLLSDVHAERQAAVDREIAGLLEQHKILDRNVIDLSLGPLSPLRNYAGEAKFRAAVSTEYLPTPPGSTSDAMDFDDDHDGDDSGTHSRAANVKSAAAIPAAVTAATADAAAARSHSPMDAPRYRRRIGRSGRMWIDRRDVVRPNRDEKSGGSSTWRFDDDDDDEPAVYEMDPLSDEALTFRTSVLGLPRSPYSSGLQRKVQRPMVASGLSDASGDGGSSSNASGNQRMPASAAVARGDYDMSSPQQQQQQQRQQQQHMLLQLQQHQQQARLMPDLQTAGTTPQTPASFWPFGSPRSALATGPLQLQSGARPLTRMAPPNLPHAQKA